MAKDIREALRDHLVTQNIVRKPSVSGTLPPCWLEPRHGVPAPGERYEGGSPTEVGPTTVVGVKLAGGIPQDPIVASTIRRTHLDIWVRTKSAPAAGTLEIALREQLDDRFNWNMGGLTIIHSQIWRELQPVSADAQAFTYIVAYGFEHYVTAPQ